jgi:hypothetical protein
MKQLRAKTKLDKEKGKLEKGAANTLIGAWKTHQARKGTTMKSTAGTRPNQRP